MVVESPANPTLELLDIRDIVRQAGEVPVFLLSLKAGGTGLNLTAASHVVLYDRWWNPAVEDQARDRAWRIGQTRTVVAHRLVCPGTVDERVEEVVAGVADPTKRRRWTYAELFDEATTIAKALRIAASCKSTTCCPGRVRHLGSVNHLRRRWRGRGTWIRSSDAALIG